VCCCRLLLLKLAHARIAVPTGRCQGLHVVVNCRSLGGQKKEGSIEHCCIWCAGCRHMSEKCVCCSVDKSGRASKWVRLA
jgi:hypothetical protein